MAEVFSLEDLARSITRQWRLLLVIIVVALAAGVGANELWPERYESTAVITVEPIAVSTTGQSSEPANMDTERVVASSTEVLTLAAKELNGPSVAELRDGLVVMVPKGAEVLSFGFTADTAEGAAAAANAIASAYQENRVTTARTVVEEASAGLTAGIAEIAAEAAALPADSPVRATLETQIQALQERQAILRSASFNAGSIVSPAVAPSESTKPSMPILLAGALFVGIFVGCFVAMIRARFQRSRTEADAGEVRTGARRQRPAKIGTENAA